MKIVQRIQKKVINLKLRMAMTKKSQPFSMGELEVVLKGLSSGKARDASGISREIFQPSNIGSDLKNWLLLLCNKVKQQGNIPKFMLKTTISTIPRKGTQTELNN